MTTASAVGTHLVCCNPDMGLCGTDLTGAPDVPHDGFVDCPTCDYLDEADATCGARLCRLRQWLRLHFGRSR
jgi:hypothetical protein